MNPKETFLSSAHRQPFANITQSEAFQSACDYALLELMMQLPDATDPSKGWDSHSQLVGARKVIDILKTIHKVEEEKKPVSTPALNYNVR